MYTVPLITSSSLVSKADFWKSITIFHNRPHLINRKIIAAEQILFCRMNDGDNPNIADSITSYGLAYELNKLDSLNRENITENLLQLILNTEKQNFQLIDCSFQNVYDLPNGIYISMRIIIPKLKTASKCLELIVLDMNNDILTVFCAAEDNGKKLPLPEFSYKIELSKEGFMRILLKQFEDADTSSAEWLADVLFPKLYKWANDDYSKGEKIVSLSALNIGRYCKVYDQLKQKYGPNLRKDWWEITKTDPQKFIFEDIAIASYLICLWSEKYLDKAKDRIRFVDCGCGNGLLVYILNQEGYSGYGIDLRRRKVWDIFDTKADLRVGTVKPDSLFPEANWLIGNHSDELTPWLPIIAFNSSLQTNYFVLPCCPYDFNGKKYIRKNTAVSQYSDYCDYIKTISEVCKFETTIDKLRIPSTKRLCLIGLRNEISDMNRVKENIELMISSKFTENNIEIVYRPSKETVRNCTQIDRNILNEIVKEIVDILLQDERFIDKGGSKWNEGGSRSIQEIYTSLPTHYLSHLKKQCGGLQTLLRNHRYLFEISNSQVAIRKPCKLEETSKYKEKPCWFNRFHPDGCLYTSVECGYNHTVISPE